MVSKSLIHWMPALLLATNASGFDRGLSIGVNFGADEVNFNGGLPSALAPGDVAGVFPQANWNNLPGAAGSAFSVVHDFAGRSAATSVTVTWSSPNTWSTTGHGEENNGFPPGYDFQDCLLPPGTVLFGSPGSGVIADDGTGSNCVVHLTDVNQGSAFGVFVVPAPAAGANVDHIHLHWRSLVGGDDGYFCSYAQFGRPGADGYSLSWATDLPNPPTYGNPGEEGAGTGVIVTVDTFDNGGGEAPGLEIKWQGQRVAFDSIYADPGLAKDYLRKGVFVEADLNIDAAGEATFTYDGRVLTALLTNWTGIAGGNFMFGARTGGACDNHWIDDLLILTFPASNRPPVLAPIGFQTVLPGETLRVTNVATDVNAPEQTLAFALDPGFPAGVSIDPTSGLLTWTPAPWQAANTYTIVVRVTDNGSPPSSDSRTFQVAVLGSLPKVSINEWMASNTGTVNDPADGAFDDWIEVFNAQANAVDLSGYHLSDDLLLSSPSDWTFPPGTFIPPQGFLLVWADNQSNQPGLHANFKLSTAGEVITLRTPDLRLLDAVIFGLQTSDVSQGRWPDGSDRIVAMNRPTPQAPNSCQPIITRQPQSLTVPVGGSATFTVEAAGASPLAYQWRRDDLNLAGQTNDTLSIAEVQPTDAGFYSVRVENSAGFALSSSAALRVQTPPGIVAPPVSLTTNLGSDVAFSVVASGSAPLSFQWRLNGQNISGATNPVFSITGLKLTDAGTYSVVVANGAGALTSTEARLALHVLLKPPGDNFSQRALLTNANGLVGGSNADATRELGEPNHAGKTGGKSVWYSWLAPSNGIATFSTSGSPFDTLVAVYTGFDLNELSLVAADDDSGPFFSSQIHFNVEAGASYQIAIDGFGGAAGDYVVNWQTEPTRQRVPTLLSQPESRTALPGSNALFSVVASPSNVTYQWFFNGAPIVQATNPTLLLAQVQAEQVGSYAVLVSSAEGRSVLSQPAILEIGPYPNARSADKVQDLFAPGLTGFLPASGANSVSIGTIGSQILNSTNSTTSLRETNHCAVIGGASRWFTLTAGGTGTFELDTEGSAFDTVLAVYLGKDLLTLQFVACNDNAFPTVGWSRVTFPVSNGVEYKIAVDGASGSSGVAPLHWALGHPPDYQVTLTPPATQVLREDDPLVLATSLVQGIPPARFQWYRDGVVIPNATNATFALDRVGRGGSGVYSVVASNVIAVARQTVAVVNLDLPLRLGVARVEQGDQRFLLLTGTASQGFTLRAGGELATSTTLWTNSLPYQLLSYKDPIPPNASHRFYWAQPWP